MKTFAVTLRFCTGDDAAYEDIRDALDDVAEDMPFAFEIVDVEES